MGGVDDGPDVYQTKIKIHVKTSIHVKIKIHVKIIKDPTRDN